MSANKNQEQTTVQQILWEALQLSGDARFAYLEKACGRDSELRREVESLLQASGQVGTFLFPQPRESGFAVPLAEKAGDHIGRYKLLEKVGEGGFGVVWMAEQQEPVRRRVALKIIKLGMDTKEVVARFEAERQALAMMEHPNIARVFDGGATEAGRPYFVMELVRGVPLTDYCDTNSLSTRERLELFIQVCHAVQHAHLKGVIHRDLKPSNILVTVRDDKPVPKVIDFGVAKATQAPLTGKTLFTAFQQWVGTPAYMSPEQAGLGSFDVDTRSDIYSLGVLLYELLTGVTPFNRQTFANAAVDEICRIIRETEPVIPSTCLESLGQKLADVARHRKTEPAALSRLIRGDLDWIVMKALEKDRTRRYETADSLARDLERHLRSEPVSAVAPKLWYILTKFIRRHKTALATGAALLLLVLAGTCVSLLEAVRASRHAAQARRAADTLAANLYAADVFLAQSAMRNGDFGLAQRSLLAHVPALGARDRRGFEWAYLWRLCRGDRLAAWKAHANAIRTVAVSPDGSLLVSTSSDHDAKLWDARTHQLLLGFDEADCAAFSPDGRLLFAAGWSGRVQIWDLKQKALLKSFSTGAEPSQMPRGQLAVSPTEPLLAVCTDGGFFGERGSVFLYNYQSGAQLRCLTNSGDRMAFSPDGKLLVTGSAGGCVTLWNAATGKAITQLRKFGGISSLAVSAQGLLAVTEFWSGDVRLWDLATRREAPRLRGHPVTAWQVAFSPDGQTLASCSSDQKVNLWDVASRTLLASMVGHESEVWSLAFSPDGKQLFSGSKDETIAVWPTMPEVKIHSVAVASTDESPPLFSPDGLMVAAGTGPGAAPVEVTLWDVETAAVKATLTQEKAALWFSPDARILVTLSTNGDLHFWELPTRTIRRRVHLSDQASPRGRTIFSNNGRIAAGLTFDSTRRWRIPRLYDVESGLCSGELRATIRSVSSLDFSPDGRLLAVAGDRLVELWDVHTRTLLHSLNAHKDGGPAVAFSPRGDILATCSVDNLVKLWAVPEGRLLTVLSGHREGVMAVTFSPDGATLASAGADGWVKLWHLATYRELAAFKHDSTAWFVRFSPDGRTMAIAPDRGKLCFLRAPSLAEADAQQGMK